MKISSAVFILFCSIILGCDSHDQTESGLSQENQNEEKDVNKKYLEGPVKLSYLNDTVPGGVVVIEDVEMAQMFREFNKANWFELQLFWLENEEGDVLEVGGSADGDGFSATYVNIWNGGKNKEEIISDFNIRNYAVAQEILALGLREPALVKKAYFRK